MHYIGLDLHAKTFSLAVLDEDSKLIFQQTSRTSGRELVRLVTALSARKRVAVEESTLADWAFRILSPHAEVIVADPRHNRYIAGDEMINDETAARKLAELLRGGMLKSVHHSESAERQAFKELVQMYHDRTKEITRHKNKLKAKFRRHGIACGGSAVYGQGDREAWRAKLPGDSARYQVQLLWHTLDHLQEQKTELRRKLYHLAQGFVQIARFEKLPGIGLIRAATFFAIIDTPHRFRTKGKLWVYCGVGIAKPISSDRPGPEHLTYFGNRALKELLKGATLSAIHTGDNPFADKYHRQVREGMAPELARLSVARSIANTMWAIWRRDEEYDPHYRCQFGDNNDNENDNS